MDGIPIPTLRSARLTLRRLRPTDHADLTALARDPDVTRYLNEGPAPSEGEVWHRMTVALGQWGLRGYGMMVATDDDGFVGRMGFFHPYDQPEPLLVYVLSQRVWGRGYATEAVALLRDWMFATHAPERLLSHIMPDNAASAAVASKLGAMRIGTTIARGTDLDIWAHAPPPVRA